MTDDQLRRWRQALLIHRKRARRGRHRRTGSGVFGRSRYLGVVTAPPSTTQPDTEGTNP